MNERSGVNFSFVVVQEMDTFAIMKLTNKMQLHRYERSGVNFSFIVGQEMDTFAIMKLTNKTQLYRLIYYS